MSKSHSLRDDLFAEAYAKTNSPLKAMIASEPALADKKPYAAVKAQRMLKRTDIQDRIDRKLQLMSKKALKQIDKLIMSDNEQIATTNAWKTVEHITGTPVHRSIGITSSVTLEDALNALD